MKGNGYWYGSLENQFTYLHVDNDGYLWALDVGDYKGIPGCVICKRIPFKGELFIHGPRTRQYEIADYYYKKRRFELTSQIRSWILEKKKDNSGGILSTVQGLPSERGTAVLDETCR